MRFRKILLRVLAVKTAVEFVAWAHWTGEQMIRRQRLEEEAGA